MNETFNYLRKNGIYTLEDLESRVSEHSAATESDFLLNVPDNGIGGFDPAVELAFLGADTFQLSPDKRHLLT